VAAVLVGVAWPAGAQEQRTSLSLQSNVTASSNGNLAPDGQERKDVIVTLGPRLQFLRQGAGLSVRSTLGADLIEATRDSRPDRVLPLASVEAQASIVDRLLFLDAGLDARQVESNAFGGRVVEASEENARTSTTVRLSPSLNYEISSRTFVAARVTDVRTRRSGSIEGDADTLQGSVKLESRPRPVGGGLEVSTDRTEYLSSLNADVRIDRVQATANVALDDAWVVGGMAGQERSTLAGVEQSGSTYGLRLAWSPSPRTSLAVTADDRFFGTGWSLTAGHRTPRMTFLLRSVREPLTAAYSSGGGFANSLAGFLDAILTGRMTNALERSAAVDELLAVRGIQSALRGSIAPSAAYAQLRTGSEFSWVYLTPRTTLTLALYAQKLQALSDADGLPVLAFPAIDDRRQKGVSAGWNWRLAPQVSIDLLGNYSRVQGLGLRASDLTREADAKATLVRQLSPRTNLSVGVGYRKLATNVVNVDSFDETTAFVGMSHRF
jgi:uncharacterized protein (PEP-CTERM system associated)